MQLLSSYIRLTHSETEEVIKFIKSGNFLILVGMLLKIAGILLLIILISLILMVMHTPATDSEKIKISNKAQEKEKPRKIIDRAANELAKKYLEQETNNTQDSVNISGSKLEK